MSLFQPTFFRNTAIKQAVLLFILALLTLMMLGYGLLFFQLQQLQRAEAASLIMTVVDEVNHQIDNQESDFGSIVRRHPSILVAYEFIIFTPTGKTLILSNSDGDANFNLPSWQMTPENENILQYSNSEVEAWYRLHNQYQMYAKVHSKSWTVWLSYYFTPMYLLPLGIFISIVALFLLWARYQTIMWQKLIDYCQTMPDVVTMGYHSIHIPKKFYGAEAAQVGHALDRFGFQLRQYFHTIEELSLRQKMLVDNAPLPLFLLNSQGHLVYFNEQFASIFKSPFRPNTLYMLTDFVAGSDSATQDTLLTLADNPTAFSLHVTDVQLNQYFDLRLNPLFESEGNFQGFSGALEVVNAYHFQLQQAWLTEKQQQDKLASFNKLWAILGHELRTPLSGMIGMLTLLNEDTANLTPEQRNTLDTLQQSGSTMLQLLNDMLDIAKLDAGKLQLHASHVDILKLCRQICGLMSANAHRQQIDLLYHAMPTIPRQILTDGGRLRQIILNLLSNAIKFTQQGYVALLIDTVPATDSLIQKKSTHPDQSPHWLKITVKDTGIGISAQEQKKLFTFFNQANSTISQQFEGTGIGLAISNNFTQMMGGFIHLHSEVGVGSEFQVYLPLDSYQPKPVFDFNTQPYKIQLIVFVKFDISVPYIEASFKQANIPTQIYTDINPHSIQQINQFLNPSFMPLFLIDELCYVGKETLFTQITAYHDAKKILTSMETERRINPGRLVKFDGFLQKPMNMSTFMAEMARLYEKNRPLPVARLTAPIFPPPHEPVVYHRPPKLPPRNTPSLSDLPHTTTPIPATNPAIGNDSLLAKPTILVAEDNYVNQVIARKYLEKMGYSVIIANNGLEAMQYLETHHEKIALVLMDCQMPILDGIEATRKIRANQNNIPIIALTANESEENRELSLSAGMNAFLLKPFSQEQLSMVLNRFLLKNTLPHSHLI